MLPFSSLLGLPARATACALPLRLRIRELVGQLATAWPGTRPMISTIATSASTVGATTRLDLQELMDSTTLIKRAEIDLQVLPPLTSPQFKKDQPVDLLL